MAQDRKSQAFPSSFSGAVRILSKLRLQERLVLSALSFSLSLIHSVVKRGGTEVEERGLEGLRRRGKKKQECIFLIHFLHRLEVSVV